MRSGRAGRQYCLGHELTPENACDCASIGGMTDDPPADKPITRLRRRIASRDEQDIDELYGLEPVYEPEQGKGGVEAESFVSIQCPWCGERLDVRVDVTAGERSYIDDCEVCCRPMELNVELEESGALRALAVRRAD